MTTDEAMTLDERNKYLRGMQTRYLNSLYAALADYYNLWQPVMHQIAKERVAATADRPAYTRRQHDRRRPPLVRLCGTHVLAAAQQQALHARQQAIDLLAFREQMDVRLARLFTYPTADPGHVQNVFETLAHPELLPAAFAALDVVPASHYSERWPSYPQPTSDPILSLRRELV